MKFEWICASKKSNILTREQMNRFISKAPDNDLFDDQGKFMDNLNKI
jgi:hypothetical protein